MSEPVKRKVKVIDAKYIKEDKGDLIRSIIILVECNEGRFRQQISSSCFYFGDKDVDKEMEKTAELLIGKNIYVVFDTDLIDKIEDNYPIRY